jgi:site-specific DNA-methyltransferase (adenine-specific)
MFEDIIARTDIPKRTDLGDIPRYNSVANKSMLYGEQGGDCNGCGEHFQKQHLEIDHIIAEAVGGTDHIENLQLLCSHCNRIKGDRGQEYLLSRLNKD